MFDKVSVRYDECQEPVVSDVSLEIPPGQKVNDVWPTVVLVNY